MKLAVVAISALVCIVSASRFDGASPNLENEATAAIGAKELVALQTMMSQTSIEEHEEKKTVHEAQIQVNSKIAMSRGEPEVDQNAKEKAGQEAFGELVVALEAMVQANKEGSDKLKAVQRARRQACETAQMELKQSYLVSSKVFGEDKRKLQTAREALRQARLDDQAELKAMKQKEPKSLATLVAAQQVKGRSRNEAFKKLEDEIRIKNQLRDKEYLKQKATNEAMRQNQMADYEKSVAEHKASKQARQQKLEELVAAKETLTQDQREEFKRLMAARTLVVRIRPKKKNCKKRQATQETPLQANAKDYEELVPMNQGSLEGLAELESPKSQKKDSP